MFSALVLEKTADGIHASVKKLDQDQLSNEGNLLVEVLYSSLNYKDGLAVTGKGKIIRGAYPFVPGIDLVGQVLESASSTFQPGDRVIGTGWGLGENVWGGYTQRQRVRSSWMVPLPETMSPLEAMTIGTAGFTAMLSVMALETHGIQPDGGDVVVTGASGGVGSMAVALLSQLGYTVTASTGKTASHDYLHALGAQAILPRQELGAGPRRPMDKARWRGAVDTVGGKTLAAVISQLGLHGSVAACGLAEASSLDTTVFPFILRGVNLLGIDSNTCPLPLRIRAWSRLAELLPSTVIQQMGQVIALEDVPMWSDKITRGQVQGRVVVDPGKVG